MTLYQKIVERGITYMMGKNHVAAGAVTIAYAAEAGALLYHVQPNWFAGLSDFSIGEHAVTVAVGMIFYFIGTILPDIDTPSSLAGRYVYIPVKHHGLTHTIWFLLIFVLCGFAFPEFWFLAAGVFVHLWMDSLSRAGVCWFYPISKYIRYNNGAFVKRHHFVWLYRTNEVSETVFMIVFTIIAMGLFLFLCVQNWISPFFQLFL